MAVLISLNVSASDKNRQRIQELFIWKVSDQLELTPEEDKAFRTIIEELNNKKQEASIKMKATVRALEKAKDEKTRVQLLGKYESELQTYLATQTEEISKLQKLFDAEKMSKYLVVKAKLTESLRILMGSGSSKPKPKLAKPKVEIEN